MSEAEENPVSSSVASPEGTPAMQEADKDTDAIAVETLNEYGLTNEDVSEAEENPISSAVAFLVSSAVAFLEGNPVMQETHRDINVTAMETLDENELTKEDMSEAEENPVSSTA